MADALDILTLEEAKAAISMEPLNADSEAVLERHITAVSRLVDEHCGPVVQRTVTAEMHDGAGPHVFLRQWPVESISLVREARGGTISTLSAVAFGGTGNGYYAGRSESDAALLSGVLTRRSGGYADDWWFGGATVEVTYVAGRYEDTESVDARFKDAAGAILRRLWKREAGTWAQTPAYFEQVDQQVGVGFYRVAAPILNEMLWADLHPPAVA